VSLALGHAQTLPKLQSAIFNSNCKNFLQRDMKWPKTRQSTVQFKLTPHKRTKMLKIVIAPRKYFTSKNSPQMFFIFLVLGTILDKIMAHANKLNFSFFTPPQK